MEDSPPIGAVLATIPILPFLPGALIGESSEELRAEYSGDKDVEIRSTRFWGSGGNEMGRWKDKIFYKIMVCSANEQCRGYRKV